MSGGTEHDQAKTTATDACNLQCMCDHDDEARYVLIKQVGEFFRDGPLPGGAERLFTGAETGRREEADHA